jgi:SRSO17 transposase
MAGALIDGVLSSAQRMASWLMAERAGLERPHRMQSLLGRDLWSADELRDIVRGYVFQALGERMACWLSTRLAS